MQKEESLNFIQATDDLPETPKDQQNIDGMISEKKQLLSSGDKKEDCVAGSKEEFEKLIKGPYKEAFGSRVQEIINQRFKEKKMSESKKSDKDNDAAGFDESTTKNTVKEKDGNDISPNDPVLNAKAAELVAMGYKKFNLSDELKNPKFKALLNGGIDMLTAYQVIHFEEIMDSSIRFGAETAAKQMADSIRFKVSRPGENGLFEGVGFGTRRDVSSLTRSKRRELARKAMMGEKISF